MNKRVNILLKRLQLCVLLCAFVLLSGCAQKDGEVSEQRESVRIEQSSYYYDQGYLPAGGWMYEMVIASENQLAKINQMTNEMVLEWTGEDFLLGQGYRLIWKDASGKQTKEMLILDGSTVSMEGFVYDTSNAQTLYDYLEALRIDEQSVE